MTYKSTKTFGHEVGISCAFRQWRATHSHCSKLHGYALSFTFTFEAEKLDDKNWVADFGGFKKLKQCLLDSFDHKTVVAVDDPLMPMFKEMHEKGLADVVILPAVGCEKFAEIAHAMATSIILDQDKNLSDRVKLVSVEVREHGANSAIYEEK